MKKTIVIGLLIAAGIAQARIEDFQHMIVKNIQSQEDLHKDLKAKVEDKAVTDNAGPKSVVVEADKKEMVSPTQKDFLRHKKELTQFKASKKVESERVATEFNNSEY